MRWTRLTENPRFGSEIPGVWPGNPLAGRTRAPVAISTTTRKHAKQAKLPPSYKMPKAPRRPATICRCGWIHRLGRPTTYPLSCEPRGAESSRSPSLIQQPPPTLPASETRNPDRTEQSKQDAACVACHTNDGEASAAKGPKTPGRNSSGGAAASSSDEPPSEGRPSVNCASYAHRNQDPRYHWSVFKTQARRRGYSCELPFDFYHRLIQLPCFYCNDMHGLFRGVDRVDNARGYKPDNVVASCSLCNYMKQGLSVRLFRQHVRRIAHCSASSSS